MAFNERNLHGVPAKNQQKMFKRFEASPMDANLLYFGASMASVKALTGIGGRLDKILVSPPSDASYLSDYRVCFDSCLHCCR